MCGITGILNTNGKPVQRQALGVFTDKLSHRGPDGSGLHIDGHVGLGHRRLAIIDLSEAGAQPMCNEDRTVWITFNGEIYNYKELGEKLRALGHRFKSTSDTEVIIHGYEEWGIEELLKQLRGMFAFAIWDSNNQKLFMARDRIGIKPLCYFTSPGLIAFASELQAFRGLHEFNSTLDLEALDLYLHFQYIPAPYSIYREVKKLPPAHYLIVNNNGSVNGPVRYWDLKFVPDYRVKEDEWAERLDSALRETVKAHLVSDVPFGAFLSGGVDSSSVVAYMSRLMEKPVSTFTIGFDNTEYDERPYAREAADVLGTEHYEEVVHPDALAILPELVEHYGEPFGDSSAIPTYYVSHTARKHVKMVLSGDGGDEIFAGYDYFAKMLLYHPEPHGVYGKSRRFLGDIARSAGIKEPLKSPRETWYQRSPYFNDEQRLKLWHPDFHYLLENSRLWNDRQFEPVKDSDLLSQCQYVDIHNYLPFDNLNKVDIASMCHGLEVRVPLLDHIFLETVSKLPPQMRLRTFNGSGRGFEKGHTGKYILKKTAEKFFRPEFLNRQKMGFAMPVPLWFAGHLKDELQERIAASSEYLSRLFDLNYVNQLIAEHNLGIDHGWRLWSLLFLAEWMKNK